jgi:hypothetical protein
MEDASAAQTAGDSSVVTSTARSLLRSEPLKLAQEIYEVQASMQSLSLANYNVHIENHRTERETRDKLAAGVGTVAKIERTASASATLLGALEGRLTALHGVHAKMRQTLLQHSAVVELLEAPAVMDACVRSSMLDEALDVSDYASTLYFTHKLWIPKPPGASSDPRSVVETVVADIQAATSDLRAAILQQLSGKVSLPLALRLLGHLRRLYVQQELARKRTHELILLHSAESVGGTAGKAARAHAGGGASAHGGPGSLAERYLAHASSAIFGLTSSEEAAIISKLRAEFLQVREHYFESAGWLTIVLGCAPPL